MVEQLDDKALLEIIKKKTAEVYASVRAAGSVDNWLMESLKALAAIQEYAATDGARMDTVLAMATVGLEPRRVLSEMIAVEVAKTIGSGAGAAEVVQKVIDAYKSK